MNGFAPFVPATSDAAASQTYFIEKDPERTLVSRVFFRLSPALRNSGVRTFRLWYSNALDATYGQGQSVLANAFCEEWTVAGLSAWTSDRLPAPDSRSPGVRKKDAAGVSFEGRHEKAVMPGEVFPTDPFSLDTDGKTALVLELRFRGHILPCHQESLLPVFRLKGNAFRPDVRTPLPVMIGVDRGQVPLIGFFGDSITQGIGAGKSENSFASLVGEAFPDVSVWNLGIGYARAWDAATDGYWITRAKQCETVVLALGVNDIVNGADAETLCGNLKRTVLLLREAGCRIILLTPVPFEYAGTQRAVWDAVCYYCEEELSRLVCEVIRTDGFLSLSPEEPYRAKYGAHPDAEGHREIASRVIDALSRQFRKT